MNRLVVKERDAVEELRKFFSLLNYEKLKGTLFYEELKLLLTNKLKNK